MSDVSSAAANVSTQTAGRAAVRSVMVDGVALDVRASTMALQQTPNQHDAVALSLVSSTMTSTDNLVGHLVSFSFGIAPRVDTWYGYVAEVSEESSDSVTLSFTLGLLGTTLPMQSGKPRFWTNKSIPSAVKELVNVNLLGYSGSDHPYRWRALAQTDGSDWATAAQFAARIGFSLFHRQGVVVCADPLDLYSSQSAYTRLVSDSDLDPSGTELLEFTPSEGTARTYEGMGSQFSYLTSDGRVAWAKQSGFDRHRFVPGVPIRSKEEADIYVESMDRAYKEWLQTASARVKGDATLYPGMNVEILTSNNTRAKTFDGKWLVVGAQHKMDNQSYQTSLALARPDKPKPAQEAPYRPYWEVAGRGKPQMFVMGDEDNRQWASSWADTRLRSLA